MRSPFLLRLARALLITIGVVIVAIFLGIVAVRQPWPNLVDQRSYLRAAGDEALKLEAGVHERGALPEFSTDPFAPTGLWHLRAVHAQEAWAVLEQRAAKGADVVPATVGVNDVFLNPGHPDLEGDAFPGLRGEPLAVRAAGWLLNMSHGAGVLGIIAGKGAPGITGVAPATRLLPFSRLDVGRDTSVGASLQYFLDHGARVANFSMAATWQVADQETIDRAYYGGLLPVAGLYNQNSDKPAYPAAYRRVLTVTSVGPQDETLDYGYGPLVDISAPGPLALTTSTALRLGPIAFGNLYAPLCCNSLATAVVSGVAALVAESDASLSSAQIEKRIKRTARKTPGMVDEAGNPTLWHPRYGYGVVDAYRAVTFDRVGPTLLGFSVELLPEGRIAVSGVAIDDIQNGGLLPKRERDAHLLGIPTSNIARVEFRVSGQDWQDATLEPLIAQPRRSEDYLRVFQGRTNTGLAPGRWAVGIRAWDSAGNVGAEFIRDLPVP